MKKILLSLALACFGCAASSYAQTTHPFAAQTFETAVVPGLPTGWTQHSSGAGISGAGAAWFTATTAGTTWGALVGAGSAGDIPAHTTYVVVDDNAYPGQSADTLKSPVFSLAGSNNPWVNYDMFFYNAQNSTSGITETCYVIGSGDGGTTWSIVDSVPGNAWGGTWNTWQASLQPYARMANVRFGFVYSDHTGAEIGCALDNISVVNFNSTYAELTQIGYNSIKTGISNNGQQLAFLVNNDSSVAITSFVAYYTLNGGGTVTQTFTPTPEISTYSSQQFLFTTPFTGAVAGTNALHVGIISVNGVPEADADSIQNSSFTLASASVQRGGLIEEFSSSTCNPCAYFNASFDPLVTSLGVNTTGVNTHEIKYQMNWPDWDDDRSYNPDGASRQAYYSCNSIPEHWVNGVQSNLGWSAPFSSTDNTNYTNEINDASILSSFMDMTLSYWINPHTPKLGITVTATPHFTKTGSYHVYVALIDQHYQNIDNEWGQLNYYNVERMMLPSGSGTVKTSWTDGVAFSYTDSVAYTCANWNLATTTPADTTTGYPAMNSTKFWSDPIYNSEAVAFVQDDASQEIMQSVIAFPNNLRVSVSTLSKVDGISIYPNPTNSDATLKFNLQQSGNVNIRVIDYTGRVMSNVMNSNLSAGSQSVNIATGNIPSGSYLVIIETAGGNNMQRLTVTKG